MPDRAWCPPAAVPLLSKALDAIERDARMVGVLATGSAASGLTDEFSDLDLVIVCRDHDQRAVLADARAFAAALGPLVASFTGEHVGEPRLLITLFGPPAAHVDLTFVAESDLDDRLEDGLILWQADGLLDAALARAAAVWPRVEPQWIEDRFWVWVHRAATKIGRGELFECLDMLNFIRARVLGPLIAEDRGHRAMGVRRLETIAPDLMPALVATVGQHDRTSCLEAVHAAIGLYRELRDKRSGVVRRTAAEDLSVDYLAMIESRVRAGTIT